MEEHDDRPPESQLRVLLGASLVRSVWGWAPNDWGLSSVRGLPAAHSEITVSAEPARSTKHGEDAPEAHKKVQHKAHGHAHGRPRSFYRLPMRRHRWGEEQYTLAASWADLFHDLIYVGAAYQLGSVVKDSFYCKEEYIASGECVGLGMGIFYSMALFQCLVRLWLSDLFLHNRYEASDLAHRLHDCLTYLAIAFAAGGIQPVETFLSMGPYTFDVPMLIALVLVMARYLELAVLSPDLATRRATAQMVVDLSLTLLCWSLALCTFPHISDGSAESPEDLWAEHRRLGLWATAALLLAGGIMVETRMLWRINRLSWFCSPDQARALLQPWPEPQV